MLILLFAGITIGLNYFFSHTDIVFMLSLLVFKFVLWGFWKLISLQNEFMCCLRLLPFALETKLTLSWSHFEEIMTKLWTVDCDYVFWSGICFFGVHVVSSIEGPIAETQPISCVNDYLLIIHIPVRGQCSLSSRIEAEHWGCSWRCRGDLIVLCLWLWLTREQSWCW